MKGLTRLSRSIVAHHLRGFFKGNDKVGVACIYCSYKEKEVQTPVNLLSSVWMQLAEGKTALGDDARDLYNNHIDKDTRPSLEEICKILKAEVGKNAKTFIVIDALDEITDEGSRIKLLESLRALQPSVNLMVTSRVLDNIARYFAGSIRLNIGARVEDLRAYISGRISRGAQLSQYVQREPELASEIENKVIGNAQKMYE
jgi:hypothetical protein